MVVRCRWKYLLTLVRTAVEGYGVVERLVKLCKNEHLNLDPKACGQFYLSIKSEKYVN